MCAPAFSPLIHQTFPSLLAGALRRKRPHDELLEAVLKVCAHFGASFRQF